LLNPDASLRECSPEQSNVQFQAVCAGRPQPGQGGRQGSPPTAPKLRPAPSPVSLDALSFDMLPDAMKDAETLVGSSDEDISMLLFGTDRCATGTGATCLVAASIQQPFVCHALDCKEDEQRGSPPKAPRLRPAPSPLGLDDLPDFDLLPDAMKDEEGLVDSSDEDISMLLFHSETSTVASYSAAADVQRPGACYAVSLDEECCSKENAALNSALETSQWLRGLSSCSTRAATPSPSLKHFEVEFVDVLGECHGF